MTFGVGTELDHYRLVEPIGEGGMGVVWKARDTSLDRDVAIKVLPDDLADDQAFLARFEREAKAVAALSHPNIVGIFGFGKASGRVYAVMELLEGQTLRDLLDTGLLPPRKAIDIARQVAEGLDAAHGKGIIHRDLKPENVFVTADGRARILDFGLATALPGSEPGDATSLRTEHLTTPGTVMGTVGYMSPEQVRAEPADSRSDIFSLGTILWEMLTGSGPFTRPTQPETMTAILREDPPDMIAGDRPLPPRLDRILRRCLQKSPDERFQSARDLAFALHSASADSEASVPGAKMARPETAGVFRAGPVWSIVLIAIGIAFAAGWLARRPAPPPKVPRVTQLTFSGSDRQPDVSPDGQLIAFASARRGISQIWLRQVDGGGEQPLTDGPDWQPSFSPDGTSVAFIRSQEGRPSAFRVPVVGGQPRKLMDDVSEIIWSPDGESLAFVSNRRGGLSVMGELGILDTASGESRIVTRVDGWSLVGLSWSPDGSRLVTTRTSRQSTGEWRHLLVDPVTGVTEELSLPNATLVSPPRWAGPSALIYARSPVAFFGSSKPDPIVRFDLDRGEERLLVWSPYLFPTRASRFEVTGIALLGDDRLLFDTFQSVQEITLYDGSAASRSVAAQGLSKDRQPSYSPAGSQLLFTSNRGGNEDLYAYDIATGRLAQLTDHTASDWDGVYSPDGRSILWSSNRSGNLEIWMADADGTRPRQISRNGVNAENPTMTADGEWIVYSSSDPENPGLFRVRPDGSDTTRIVAGQAQLPEVSPDGRFVAYYVLSQWKSFSEIFVADVMTGELLDFSVQLDWKPDSPNVTYGRSRWLPDGTALAFVGLDDGGNVRILAQDFVPGRDTTSSRRVLLATPDDVVVESFGISPDGRQFAISTLQTVTALNLADGLEKLR
jgi:Tol biopolymer transport system component/serine/threonine protein kinase